MDPRVAVDPPTSITGLDTQPRTARILRRARGVAALLILLQVTIYAPLPGVDVPPDLHAVGTALAGALLVVNLVSWLCSRRHVGSVGRARLAWAELAADTVLTLAVVWLFNFDPTTQARALLILPVLEGALRGAMRGALGVSAGVLTAYAVQHLSAARATPQHQLLFLGTIFIAVALASGLLVQRFRAEAVATQEASDAAARAHEVVLRHAAELRLMQDKLARRAFEDSLTKLANRARFDDELAGALDGPPPALVGVVYLDIDGFKTMNDRYGHAVGDELLIAIARTLVAAAPPPALVARQGGDEFAILLPQIVGPEVLPNTLDRLTAALAAPQVLSIGPISVSASMGAAIGRASSDQPGAVMRQADQAMYAAKRHGDRHWFIASEDPAPEAPRIWADR